MWEEIKHIKSTPQQLRKFGLLISGVILVIAGYNYFFGNPALVYLANIAIILGIGALAYPHPLKPIYWVWMAIAVVLGWIMSRVILIVLFYLVLTPIGLIGRISGKRFLKLDFDREASSYWERREAQSDPKTCEKQF
jgi:hypothetical protein